jgi:hypothetical protein
MISLATAALLVAGMYGLRKIFRERKTAEAAPQGG